MPAYKIDHIGVAVASIDEALEIYRVLGLRESGREEVASQRVRTAMLPVGESRIELLEATAEDSPVAKFLSRRGPGMHHVCLAVDDLAGAVADLRARGYRLLQPEPVRGADGKNVIFLHPDAGQGVLIELSQDAERGSR